MNEYPINISLHTGLEINSRYLTILMNLLSQGGADRFYIEYRSQYGYWDGMGKDKVEVFVNKIIQRERLPHAALFAETALLSEFDPQFVDICYVEIKKK